jgi:uncharacterized protein YeaO (DUF488 family)
MFSLREAIEEQDMSIRIVRLGSPRDKGEGIRVGTVRRPPRGIHKGEYSSLNFYDTWLPQLAPSAELLNQARKGLDSAESWRAFERKYMRELSSPDNLRLLDLLSAFSGQTDFAIGCYCEDEKKCHRSILRKVLENHGATFR